MDTKLISKVKSSLGCDSIDINECRQAKHANTRKAFVDMVILKDVDSGELFDKIHEIFEQHSLQRPYHDWYHTCCVVEGTIQGLRYSLSHDLLESDDQQAKVNSTILAAAFHDIGHTGVKDPDIVNISRSIMIAHRFLIDLGLNQPRDPQNRLIVPFMLETLQATQYPFTREPLNHYQAVLRDADLLQILEPTWFDDLYINMYEEFLEGSPQLSFEQFCSNERWFIEKAKFFSDWFHNEKKGIFSSVAIHRVQKVCEKVELLKV
ncbi:hypothetical protein [Pseudomonas putida]|uniref:Uncharacterized protein n=1 Tax=Pseudomonas putida TaxID=303 RepID=A0A8I1EBQ2_PSEPU|nr:hypothetical protein [Pseudomonas putida]MBI6882349.1 hypothetical protein [Pseudomonas putida]